MVVTLRGGAALIRLNRVARQAVVGLCTEASRLGSGGRGLVLERLGARRSGGRGVGVPDGTAVAVSKAYVEGLQAVTRVSQTRPDGDSSAAAEATKRVSRRGARNDGPVKHGSELNSELVSLRIAIDFKRCASLAISGCTSGVAVGIPSFTGTVALVVPDFGPAQGLGFKVTLVVELGGCGRLTGRKGATVSCLRREHVARAGATTTGLEGGAMGPI